ncbi:precorrin-3B synthase [Microvirga yunnanensis]|uniref:precorrin-3B synthase n=1 Tax=Microvirga yunnanensis TaxID=2953740 RepID=UPI0021C9C594|nr:precorrin-3B synthase [Microvirga sp. HBU65207]
MNALPVDTRRRGWCPGVRRPMATGDGLLVRLHPFAGGLTAAGARLVAEAARAHGNGHLDITARGNLQIRGVSDETYPGLLALLDRLGLAEPEGDGPHRLTVLSPLAGLDPLDRFDPMALARAVESLGAVGDGLPAKVFVAVDGGGAMPLDGLGADLHLTAAGTGGVAFGVPSAGDLRGIGTASPADAPDAVRAILAGFAALRRTGGTEARRLRDLGPDLLDGLAASAGLAPGPATLRRGAPPRAGILSAADGRAVLLALPFGRCRTGQLIQAAGWSERFGTGEIRLSFTRGILLPGLSDRDVPALLDEARQAGFVTDPGDPRLSLIACPGRPDCAGAATPAPADALRLAAACPDLLARGVTVHVSGCPKGCAHPGSADLTLAGRPDGRYDVVLQGATRDAPLLHLSLDELMIRLMPAKTSHDLGAAFPERSR